MSDLAAYVKAREQGVQPASTAGESTAMAMAVSDATGTAFRADAL